MRAAEYHAPERVLVHLSDTHLRAAGSRLYDEIDSAERLSRALSSIESSGLRPDAVVITGDLADYGEPAAYEQLRALVDPFVGRVGTRIVWVMGNHDHRPAFRSALLDDSGSDAAFAPLDRVDELDGLRLVTLDTTVPGEHHGELSTAQLEWLRGVLATPAPLGTILAMHHPPVPSVLPLAATVELRDQSGLADVLRGSDVRSIIAGHLHYSTFATFAGIPVSVASATCYTQDLTVPVGGTRPQDAAQGYNLVHVYAETVVHSVVAVPVEPHPLEYVDAADARRRLAEAGIDVPRLSEARRIAPPTEPLSVLR